MNSKNEMKLKFIINISVIFLFSNLYSQPYLTVYRNFGYIQEKRTLQLSVGTNLYKIGDIARNIIPGSIFIELDEKEPVIEQHYNFNLFNISQFLDGFTGDKVCLLYTSPSPRDLSTSRMPSSA